MSEDPAAAASRRAPETERPDDASTPFERFEHVLRKVVAVPKADVDKLRNGSGR